MKVYRVGGSVRDELLGLPVKDHDYVVVGSTPEEMERLGFKPVGKDFPVFLHPETKEEYALARTERKVARGYKGFEIFASREVTLREDLVRRDLTINAIALDEHGNVIDPFGGVEDLERGILRHVGPAFVEDPVRILRVARFAARFGFQVAPETMALMREMVHTGEVEHLVAERVWQELSRGLMEDRPSRMFYVLRECGALARVLPEIDALFGVPQPPEPHPEVDTGLHTMMVIDYCAREGHPLPVRFAALTHDLGKAATPKEDWPRHHGHERKSVELVENLSERVRAPTACRDLARITARYHGDVHRALELRAATVLDLLHGTDALRRPERFRQFLDACAADFHGRPGYAERPYPPRARLLAALDAAASVDAGALARGAADTAAIAARVRQARIAAIRARFDAVGSGEPEQ
ncbi:MAG: multifunctional CCA addition/repair protein [Pseudomonadota bacterium]